MSEDLYARLGLTYSSNLTTRHLHTAYLQSLNHWRLSDHPDKDPLVRSIQEAWDILVLRHKIHEFNLRQSRDQLIITLEQFQKYQFANSAHRADILSASYEQRLARLQGSQPDTYSRLRAMTLAIGDYIQITPDDIHQQQGVIGSFVKEHLAQLFLAPFITEDLRVLTNHLSNSPSLFEEVLEAALPEASSFKQTYEIVGIALTKYPRRRDANLLIWHQILVLRFQLLISKYHPAWAPEDENPVALFIRVAFLGQVPRNENLPALNRFLMLKELEQLILANDDEEIEYALKEVVRAFGRSEIAALAARIRTDWLNKYPRLLTGPRADVVSIQQLRQLRCERIFTSSYSLEP